MPRARKPARLWLRPAYKSRATTWVILDGGKQFRIGCGEHDRSGAEGEIAEHMGRHFLAKPPAKHRDAADVGVAEVVAHYLQIKSDGARRPRELGARAEALMASSGNNTLNDITTSMSAAYVKQRSTPTAARRELEDL